jgi:hypothetical protein
MHQSSWFHSPEIVEFMNAVDYRTCRGILHIHEMTATKDGEPKITAKMACVCVYAGFDASFGTEQITVYHNNLLSLTYIIHHGTTQTRDIQDDSRVNARHRRKPRL